jgi:hypothetical protein
MQLQCSWLHAGHMGLACVQMQGCSCTHAPLHLHPRQLPRTAQVVSVAGAQQPHSPRRASALAASTTMLTCQAPPLSCKLWPYQQ